jgi:hypothetical protein
MNNSIFIGKMVRLLAAGLLLVVSTNGFAADRYRVSAQFYHLGELIGKPMMEVELGETTAGEYSAEGEAHYKIVVLVRPVADGEVYVSMQFSSGKIDIQPNLLANIGKPRSATIKKVRVNLLVEEIEEEKTEVKSILSTALNHH